MPGLRGFGGGNFPTSFSEYFSELIFFDNIDIESALITLEGGSSGTISLFLSNNDGSTWEAATENILHTFTTTGQKLRFRIVGFSGAIVDDPIRVDYVTA